jgi:hypothetical protein
MDHIRSNAFKVALELKSREPQDGDWMRWTTSLNMALAYSHLHDRDYTAALERFKAVVENVNMLKLWPNMIASSVAACLFAGLIEAKFGNHASGTAFFNEGGKIFKAGISLLDPRDYWTSHDIIGASLYLHECNNEKLVLGGNGPIHPRGSRLWDLYRKLMAENFLI